MIIAYFTHLQVVVGTVILMDIFRMDLHFVDINVIVANKDVRIAVMEVRAKIASKDIIYLRLIMVVPVIHVLVDAGHVHRHICVLTVMQVGFLCTITMEMFYVHKHVLK